MQILFLEKMLEMYSKKLNIKKRGFTMDFGSILLIVFIVLKLIGTIEWSWIWVLSPLWIEFILLFIIEILKDWPFNNKKSLRKGDKIRW